MTGIPTRQGYPLYISAINLVDLYRIEDVRPENKQMLPPHSGSHVTRSGNGRKDVVLIHYLVITIAAQINVSSSPKVLPDRNQYKSGIYFL